jgi:hypothetical protein
MPLVRAKAIKDVGTFAVALFVVPGRPSRFTITIIIRIGFDLVASRC